jgi:hypothetical protein
MSGSSNGSAGGEGAAFMQGGTGGPMGSGTHPLELAGMVSPDRALDDYRTFAIYPPHSRPLGVQNEDMLHPNRRYETLLPIEEDSEIYYLFTADKYRVIGTEPITFTLYAKKGSSMSKKRLEIDLTKSVIRKGSDPATAKHVSELPMVKNDSSEFSAEYNPSQIMPSVKTAGKYLASVAFKVSGESASFDIPFEYFPEQTIPARFTGNFTEEIKQGSLYINAEINVEREGFYVIDANVFNELGGPISYAIIKTELAKGKSKIPIQIFGKIIHDSGSEPPYIIKNLRGFRFIEVTKPDIELMDREMVPEYEKEYKTKKYSKKQFSDKEWDSEEKKRRIEFLEEQSGMK